MVPKMKLTVDATFVDGRDALEPVGKDVVVCSVTVSTDDGQTSRWTSTEKTAGEALSWAVARALDTIEVKR